MCDEKRRKPDLLHHREIPAVHVRLRQRIERREGLVEQCRLPRKQIRPQQGRTLAHAARKLRGIVLRGPGQAEMRQKLRSPRPRFLLLHAADDERERDIVLDRIIRKQMVLLQHVADAPGAPGDVLAVQQDPPRLRAVQPGDDRKQRRLPAARSAEDADELALLEREVHVLQDPLLSVVGKAHVFDFQNAHKKASAGYRQRLRWTSSARDAPYLSTPALSGSDQRV